MFPKGSSEGHDAPTSGLSLCSRDASPWRPAGRTRVAWTARDTPREPTGQGKHRAALPTAPGCQAGNTQRSCPVPSAALVWGGVMATFRDQKTSAASRRKLKRVTR